MASLPEVCMNQQRPFMTSVENSRFEDLRFEIYQIQDSKHHIPNRRDAIHRVSGLDYAKNGC